MELLCPKCSKQLPEVEILKYRFCPHCGAEIAAEPKKLEDAFLTIPPDLAPQHPKQTPKSLSLDTQTGKKLTLNGRFNDQTIEPQTTTTQPQAKLKPPDIPPPSSFFRTPSEPIKPPPQDIHKQPPTKNRNKIIIAVLISLAVVILIIGGLFTF
jgi:DNA-directed RNA polymerase subunit RPC12/RpoP